MARLTRGEVVTRFIYGSKTMGETIQRGYDNEDYLLDGIVDEGAYCNNNCLSCEMECPYKAY